MTTWYFYNNGGGDTDGNNPNNWYGGPNGTYPVGAVPSFSNGDTVDIQSDLDSNVYDFGINIIIDEGVVVTVNTTINSWQSVINNGTLYVTNGDGSNAFNGGVITNYGDLYNMYGAIYLYGSITNYGLFINNAIINTEWSGNGITNLGTFYNNDLYSNIGYMDNTSGLYINNGLFNNAGLFVRGAFTNNGTFNNNLFFNNNGSGDTDWNNSNNWWYDAFFGYFIGSVPTIDPVYDMVNILSPLDTNIPQFLPFKTFISYYGPVSINNVVVNRNMMILDGGAILNNFHCFLNENSIFAGPACYINNYSHFSNEATVILDGYSTTFYNIVSGYLENSGEIIINGSNINFNEAGSMNNTGSLTINAGSLSAAYINPIGYTGKYVLSGGESTNFYETSAWYFDDTAIIATGFVPTILYDSIIVNNSNLDGDTAPNDINFQFINNNIYNINSSATTIDNIFTNNGTININSNFLTNNGTLTNNYIINNNNTFINNGTMGFNLSGSFTNNGTFTNGSYTTRFKGQISPQIPSSASWGNIFL